MPAGTVKFKPVKTALLLEVFTVFPEVINKVVAVVNDEVITQQDIDQLLAVLYAQFSQSDKGDAVIKKWKRLKKISLIRL